MKRKIIFAERFAVQKAEPERHIADEDAVNMRIADNLSNIKIELEA